MIICIEGVDRSGKTTLVKELEKKGFKSIHFSSPDKKFSQPGYVGPTYAETLAELFVSLAGQNVVLDRSHYGESVWSQVYNRTPMLDHDDIDMLRQLEGEDVRRILMHDPDINSHWARCVENKEPLTQVQFAQARQKFYMMGEIYGFEVKTLNDIPQLIAEITGEREPPKSTSTASNSNTLLPMATNGNSEGGVELAKAQISDQDEKSTRKAKDTSMTPEQLKLLQANVINEVMSSRIVKKKGDVYDILEDKIRGFLNNELSILLGTNKLSLSFSDEDITILKLLINKVKEKK